MHRVMADGEASGPDRERKFILVPDQADAFLREHADRLDEEIRDRERPIAVTRTTYLDTPRLDYFLSSTGPQARRLRLRQYGAAADGEAPLVFAETCYLELKESCGSVRTKARFAAPVGLILRILDDPDRSYPAAGALQPILARLRAADHFACLTTVYRRRSYLGHPGAVRVTLDEELTFCRPLPAPEGALAAPPEVVGHGPDRVLEVKYRGEPPPWLQAAMEGLVEHPQFSKFRLGMLAVQRAVDASAAAAGGTYGTSL